MDELQIQKEYEIKCGKCHLLMACVINTNARENHYNPKKNKKTLKTQFKCVECYSCGEESFLTPVFEGRTFILPPDDGIQLINEGTFQKEDRTIVSWFKTKRKKK